jgi:hypothetical protein
MSGVARLLERAARLGVRLWAEGDRLLWEAEQEPPSALLAELKPSRRELLEALAPRPAPSAADLLPAEGSLPARVIAAGGVSRIGGARADAVTCWAEFPRAAPPELIADLSAAGWHISYMGVREDGGGA